MTLDSATRTRLFDPRPAFEDSFVFAAVVAVVAAMVLLPLVARTLPPKARHDVMERWRGWLVLAPLIMLPILLGAAWVFLGTATLALLCYREFARATGLFRSRLVSAAVVVAMLVTYFAVADHYYEFFVALWPLSVGLIALAGLISDRPQGFIQRVALGVLAYMLFGAGLGHLAYFANDDLYRRILVWLILCVELNDIFAFTTGKLLGPLTGGIRLAPRTSPNKTLAGGVGALVLTTAVAALLGRFAWAGTALAAWPSDCHGAVDRRAGTSGRSAPERRKARHRHQRLRPDVPRTWRIAGPLRLAHARASCGVSLCRLPAWGWLWSYRAYLYAVLVLNGLVLL